MAPCVNAGRIPQEPIEDQAGSGPGENDSVRPKDFYACA